MHRIIWVQGKRRRLITLQKGFQMITWIMRTMQRGVLMLMRNIMALTNICFLIRVSWCEFLVFTFVITIKTSDYFFSLHNIFVIFSAEEDHITSHGHYMHQTTNDINNPGVEYHGSRLGSRMGSVLGSLHGGSVCGSVRGSPSPLMPPVSMMHSTHGTEAQQ